MEVLAQVGASMATRQVNLQDFRTTPAALGFSVMTGTRAQGSQLPAQPHAPSGSLAES